MSNQLIFMRLCGWIVPSGYITQHLFKAWDRNHLVVFMKGKVCSVKKIALPIRTDNEVCSHGVLFASEYTNKLNHGMISKDLLIPEKIIKGNYELCIT